MENFTEKLNEIENQLRLLCSEKGISRDSLPTYKDFTTGEKFVILRLLEAKFSITKDELACMSNRFNNVIYLGHYRMKRDNK
jgi:hypothetical protein